MTALRDLAEAARMMPWDKTAADVPFASRKAFRDAITPEIFLQMLEVLQACMLEADAYEARTGRMLSGDWPEMARELITKVTK